MFEVENLRNGKRYSSSGFTFGNRKSCATRRYKRRLCSCYRFRDIKSSTSWFPNADLFERANWYIDRTVVRSNKEISRSGLVFEVEYLRNGKRYSSSVFFFGNRKSCATRRYKRRLCGCYRFRDIKSSTSWFPNADLFERANWYIDRTVVRSNKELSRSGLVFEVEYLRNGERYSSFVLTFGNRRSCATRRYKRRLCSCYRFRDIKSSTSWFPNADLYDVAKTTPVRMYSHG